MICLARDVKAYFAQAKQVWTPMSSKKRANKIS